MSLTSSESAVTLFVVGTPIGNLGDITLRAVDTLRRVGLVAAEDTRRSRALLTHLGITGKPLVSIESHASDRHVEQIVAALLDGTDVALVTDAGMPCISDPGARVVRGAVERGIRVTVVPGPSSVSAAAALSGLIEGAYLFMGFLPRRGTRRSDALAKIQGSDEPVILFEAPTRCEQTLTELADLMPDRPVCVTRELTKLHEEVVRGSLGSLPPREWRGEICIVLGPALPRASADPNLDELDAQIEGLLAGGASTRSVLDALGRVAGLSRRDLYARVEALRAPQRAQEPD